MGRQLISSCYFFFLKNNLIITGLESDYAIKMILSDVYHVQTQPKLMTINGQPDETFIFDGVDNVSNICKDAVFKKNVLQVITPKI